MKWRRHVALFVAVAMVIVLAVVLWRPPESSDGDRDRNASVESDSPGTDATGEAEPGATAEQPTGGSPRSVALDPGEDYPDPTPAIEAFIDALSVVDTDTLVAMYATDAAQAREAARGFASRFSRVDIIRHGYDLAAVQRVRSRGEAAWVYVTADVVDSGVQLRRTFVVPLELVDDRWYVSPIGEDTPQVELLGTLDLSR